MAKEILVIPNGQVIFFLVYPTPPVVIAGDPQVLTLPSSELSPEVATFLGDALCAIIDAGRASWEIHTVNRGHKETLPELADRAKLKWQKWAQKESGRVAAWAAELANIRWIHV